MKSITRELTLVRLRGAGHQLAALEPLLLMAVAPFLLFPGPFAPYCIVPLLVPWLGRWLATGRLSRYTPLNAPMFLLLTMAGVAYWVSPDPALSWAKLWGIVLQVAIYFAVVNYATSERRILWVGNGLLIGTLFVAGLSLVGTDWSSVRLLELDFIYQRIPSLINGLPGSGVPRASSLFSPREVGATMAMLLPISMMVVLFSRRRQWRIVALVAVVLATGVLLLSQALMGIAGMLLASGFMLLWWRRWTIIPVALLGLGVLIRIVQFGPQKLALTLLDIQHSLGIGFVLRFDMWSRALAMIRDMPFTGIGLNTFSLVQSHFYTGYLIGPEVHSHNLFLQLAVDLGLPGLFIFLWVVIGLCFMGYHAYPRLTNREIQLLLVGLLAGVIAYVGGGVLDVVTLGAKPVAGLWMMLGAVGAIWASTETDAPRRTFHMPKEAVAIVAFVLPFSIAAVLLPAKWYGNWGAVKAHQALFIARTQQQLPSDLAHQAIGYLERSLVYQPGNAQFYGILGSLYAWQGDYQTAYDRLRRRVELDGPFAFEVYAPYEIWRRQLQGESLPLPWEGTFQIYSHWTTRFPDRAEFYLLWAEAKDYRDGMPDPGMTLLQRGVEQKANPAPLLHYSINKQLGSDGWQGEGEDS